MMNILGIETSCDETAAAVVQDGKTIRSNVVLSQIDIHREFGGVVPEVASRSHIEAILPVIEKSLKDAKTGWSDIDAIAVTYGPGLPGSLLMGVLTARTLAIVKNKPLIPVNHVEAHMYANFLDSAETPEFPLLCLIVSGGHSQLVLFRGHHDYQLLGQTVDDAVGEAFDKIAKLLGLSYPGGPAIAQMAEKGNAERYQFPIAKLTGRYDFSFSGLKTAVLRQAQAVVGQDHSFPSYRLAPLLSAQQTADLAASFQRAAVRSLVDKTVLAYREYAPKQVVIAGGVAANHELRRQLAEALPLDLDFAPAELCTDNGAMIASLGYFLSQKGVAADPYSLESDPSLAM